MKIKMSAVNFLRKKRYSEWVKTYRRHLLNIKKITETIIEETTGSLLVLPTDKFFQLLYENTRVENRITESNLKINYE